jgi:hypothetical protein
VEKDRGGAKDPLKRERWSMKRAVVIVMAGLFFMAAPYVAGAQTAPSGTVIAFERMVGVFGPFLGPTNAIRGVSGAGAPWVIEEGRGELDGDGTLFVDVRGLVLADDPAVAPERRLTNPAAGFRAVVSCMTVDEVGGTTFMNVTTEVFPATPTGDAVIEANVALPTPCIAPIVFVTNPAGNWFAATGR